MILKLLSAKGGIPERVSNAVCAQKDLETLDWWILLSGVSENADDFCKKAELIILKISSLSCFVFYGFKKFIISMIS